MATMRPVRWREGMFLRPHHFQHHDLFLEARQIAYFQAGHSYGWGLVRLEIQEASLANFVFDVKALRAVYPDGALVDVPGNSRLPSRNIDPKGMAVGDPLPVILGLRRLEDRRAATLPEGVGKGETRFLNVEEEAYDVDIGKEPTPVEKLEYDLQLFVGNETTTGYEILPIASVSLTGNQAKPLQMTHGFAPPSLLLSAAPVLHDAARAVVDRLTTVLRKMDDIRGSEKIRELVLYQALAGCLPVLRDMVIVGNVHPRDGYQEMARLAGTLFYRDMRARSFDEIPAYDHQEPGPVFEQLRELIQELSEPVFTERYRRIPMERVGDQFRVGVPAEARKPGVRLFLEIHASDSVPRLRDLMMKARISNPSRVEHLTRFALPGVATEMQAGPPAELPPGQTGTYFRLKIEEGNEWANQVLPANELTLFLLGTPPDVRINLVLVFPGT